MDPLGFGLENFDGIGRWRDEISGSPVDASGVLVTGEPFNGPAELPVVSFASPGKASLSKPPVRLAVLYMPNGVNPHAWTPSGVYREFELSEILSPLSDVKDDLLVLTELWNATTNTGDGHYVKTGGFLTGTTITRTTCSDLRSGNVSMDQYLAQRIGNLTHLPSLELGIEAVATGVDANVGFTHLYASHIL